jgi:hypothetical protein
VDCESSFFNFNLFAFDRQTLTRSSVSGKTLLPCK